MVAVESWDTIVDWCSSHAPVTADAVLPPAPADDLQAAQDRTGASSWPSDVVDFCARCNGLARVVGSSILSGWRPLSLDELVEAWEFVAAVAAPVPALSPEAAAREANLIAMSGRAPIVHDVEADPAGTPTGQFVAAWLPIAEDLNGSYLVVDRRRAVGDLILGILGAWLAPATSPVSTRPPRPRRSSSSTRPTVG